MELQVIAEAADPSGILVGTGSTLGQLFIGGLLSVISFLVRSWLMDLIREVKTMRVAVDENTRVTTIALLEMAALIPGARPMLEQVKASVDARLKPPTE